MEETDVRPEIVSMLKEGMSYQEIASFLNVKYPGNSFNCNEIHRIEKMDVPGNGMKNLLRSILDIPLNRSCTWCGDRSIVKIKYGETGDVILPSSIMASCPKHVYIFENDMPEIELTKEFSMECCHHLLNYDGKCAFDHGHSFLLQVTVKNPINPLTSMVIDFGDIKRIVTEKVISELDHNDINKVLDTMNPTSEVMLVWIWKQLELANLKGIYKIRLWETSNSFATLYKDDLIKSLIKTKRGIYG